MVANSPDRDPAKRIVLAATAAFALGCSVGGGEGEIRGPVLAADCDLEESSYELSPSFFGAEVTAEQLNLRIQRGSRIEGAADGLAIQVQDVNDIRMNRLGLPIDISDDYLSPVRAVFYLNATCRSGFPSAYRVVPVLLNATGGTIRFSAIYAPDLEPAAVLIEAELSDVRFTDPAMPEERRATLSGFFSFFYQRGSPSQRFP